jgi:hypothetical protein
MLGNRVVKMFCLDDRFRCEVNVLLRYIVEMLGLDVRAMCC